MSYWEGSGYQAAREDENERLKKEHHTATTFQDREFIMNNYKTMPIAEIGKKLNATESTIRFILKTNGIII